MSKTSTKNLTLKAMREQLTMLQKKGNLEAFTERRITGQANNNGEQWGCEQIKEYCLKHCEKLGAGVTKVVYGTTHLAISLVQNNNGYKRFGNQAKKQIDTWLKYQDTPDNIYLCPILNYGLHRGDKVNENDDRYRDKTYIVSIRAEMHGNLGQNIEQAEIKNGYTGQQLYDRVHQKLQDFREFINRSRIGDLHSGNIGVIYDYYKNEYRAVIIDYGL